MQEGNIMSLTEEESKKIFDEFKKEIIQKMTDCRMIYNYYLRRGFHLIPDEKINEKVKLIQSFLIASEYNYVIRLYKIAEILDGWKNKNE